MFQFHVRPSKRDASGDASKRAGQLIFQTQRSHSSTRTRSISLVRSGCRRTKIGKRQFRTDFHRTLQRRGQSKREAGGRFRFCNQRAKSSKWPTTLCFCTTAPITPPYLSMIGNIRRDIPSNLLPMLGNRTNSPLPSSFSFYGCINSICQFHLFCFFKIL